jgi:hypothetical protein
MWFKKKRPAEFKRNGTPTDRFRLTDSLEVPVWISRDPETDRVRVRWSIDGYNRDNPDQPRRLLRIEQALELPYFTMELAELIAGLEALPDAARAEFTHMAEVMRHVCERLRSNGRMLDEQRGTVEPSRHLTLG